MRTRVILLVAVWLAACGPATPVDDLFYVRSNGALMPVWLRGNPSSGTVVLFLAGGPGPGLFYEEEPVFRRLEQKYVVAFWDQRAAGGVQGTAAPETLTLAQYVADADAVIQAIEQRQKPARMPRDGSQ